MAKAATEDRNNSGRFQPGNVGGPGRPRRETERAYLAIIAEACPPEAWREIVQRAVKQATVLGDPVARAWLANYLVGKPAHEAATLHTLAVEEEAGADPVGLEAKQRRSTDQYLELMAGS